MHSNFVRIKSKLVLTSQICFPKKIILLRGNHECRVITSHFTFREEMLSKYDLGTYDLLMESFDAMPIVSVINDQYLAVHGGVSPHFPSLSELNELNRFMEIPAEGLLCDIMWADPLDD